MDNVQSNTTNKSILHSSHSFGNSRVQIVGVRSLLRAFLNVVQIVVNHDADHMIQLLFLTCTVQLHAHLWKGDTVHYFTPTGHLQHYTLCVYILKLAGPLLQKYSRLYKVACHQPRRDIRKQSFLHSSLSSHVLSCCICVQSFPTLPQLGFSTISFPVPF